jgi:hypothetical protein
LGDLGYGETNFLSSDVRCIRSACFSRHGRSACANRHRNSDRALSLYANQGEFRRNGPTPQLLSASNNGFGLLVTVALDQTVDAQPLVVPNQNVSCGAYATHACLPGAYEVVYVATENNTVYAINGANGAILMRRNFGPTDIVWGIRATPYADLVSGHLYLFTAIRIESSNIISLHSINLEDLTDATPKFGVNRSKVASTFANGTEATFFTPSDEKERTALLLVNGTIYAGFAPVFGL